MTTAATLNLYQKLAAISGGLGALKKDGKAPDIMGGYAFLSHGSLMGHLRNELAAHGVVIIPAITHVESHVVLVGEKQKPTNHVTVKMAFTVFNADDPQERIHTDWAGEGMDASDKGTQKAATSAEKYFLMKLFKVSDQDDPDGSEAEPVAANPAWVARPAPVQSSAPITTNPPPAHACPECGSPLRLVKAGTSATTGKSYDAFASCTAKCGWKPTRENPTMGLVA